MPSDTEEGKQASPMFLSMSVIYLIFSWIEVNDDSAA
jgi:hypothetical protein